jgi:hypothetical protein
VSDVIFVHGTGVRQPRYDELLEKFTKGLRAQRADVSVVPCYWGEAHGARLRSGGASVPAYDMTRGPGYVDDKDQEAALWSLLYADPIWELAVLALAAPDAGELLLGWQPPAEQLDAAFRTLQPDDRLAAALDDAGLAAVFRDARDEVARSSAYIDAVELAGESLGELASAIARATVAMAIARAEESAGAIAITGDTRDRLVDLLVEAVGGAERGLGARTGRVAFGLAMRFGGTSMMSRKRGALTDATAPAAGDVLLYQARGEPIRRHIADCVGKATPPVTIVGHSLGGVAAVDLLRADPPAGVELLVTVGSQAPFLYEIGALSCLPFGAALPSTFPRWLNLFDLRDFLSYVGHTVFQGRVRDEKVDNGQPFPKSHSAYWDNEQVYALIGAALP